MMAPRHITLFTALTLTACQGSFIASDEPDAGTGDMSSAAGGEDMRAPAPEDMTPAVADMRALPEDMSQGGDLGAARDMSAPPDASPDMAPAPRDDARVVSHTLPAAMDCGQTVQAQVTLENTGATTWSREAMYRVGAVNGEDTLAAQPRERLPRDTPIAPGESHTFTVELTAPAQEGAHTTAWQMVISGGTWFGEVARQRVEVTCPTSGEPPPPQLDQVVWLHTDVSGWPATATLDPITFEGGQICMPYDRTNTWEIRNLDGPDVVANPWVFIYDWSEQRWYAATWEWLRPGQTCKAMTSVAGDHIKTAPYDAASGWRPASGEVLYFMISGLTRFNLLSNHQERTNLVRVVWP